MMVLVFGLLLQTLRPAPAPDAWSLPEGGDDGGVFVAAQVFSGIDATLAATEPETLVPQFRLDRADVGGGFVYEDFVGLVLRFETIRSAAPQSAFGIDGDSLLPRLKLGYGTVRPRFDLWGIAVLIEGRAGLLPSPWLSRIENHMGARGLGALSSESNGFFPTSDLGVAVNANIGGLVDFGISLENGEGKNEVERNPGKNITAVIGVAHAVGTVFGSDLALGATALYRDGSVGAGAARDHRVAAAVFADHALAHVLVEGVYGLGFAGRAEQQPALVNVAVDANLWPSFLGVAGRWALVSADTGVEDAWSQQFAAALFSDFGLALHDSRLLRRVRLYVGVAGNSVGAGAGPFPGVPAAGEAWRGFAAVEFNGASDVFDPFPPASTP